MSRILLADIGGTYARFTLADDRSIGSTWSTEVGAHGRAIDALRAFLALDRAREPVSGALLAAAGPVQGGRCKLTNAAWTLDEEEIASGLQLPWVRIVNDLEAVAAGLPDIDPRADPVDRARRCASRRADGHRLARERDWAWRAWSSVRPAAVW
jgi:glucokinase